MAALEKIRKRAVILTIVIGAGLLAFILEEGVRASSSFMHDTTIAKVGGEKIDAQDFQKKVELFNQQMEKSGQQNKQDAAVIAQEVLQNMEMETAINLECEANAIEVGNEEMGLMLDNSQEAGAYFQQYAQVAKANGGVKAQSPSQLDKIVNSDPVCLQLQLPALWGAMKENLTLQLKYQKLMMLMNGAITANQLDIAQAKADAAVVTVQIAKKDFSSLDDAKYKPTDAEVKAVYDEYKTMFKTNGEQRLIYFVYSNIEPSDKDLKAGEAIINKAYALLGTPAGADSIRNMGDFQTQEMTVTEKQAIDAFKQQQLGNDSAFSTWLKGGGAAPFKANSGNNYVLFKVKKVDASLPDTAKVVSYPLPTDAKKQEAVLAQLNAGKAPQEIKDIDQEVLKQVLAQGAQSIPVQSLGDDSMKTKVASTWAAKFCIEKNENGAFAVKTTGLTYNKFYTLIYATYEIVPSNATTNQKDNAIEVFAHDNTTADAFYKNAQAKGFQLQQQYISSATPELGYNAQYAQYGGGGIPNTRKAIKWALTDAKAGEVSPVFRDNNNVLVAVAVKEIYDGDYLPLTDPTVKEYCTTKAMNLKKAAEYKKQFDGKAKDVAGYAKCFGDSVMTTQVSFEAAQMEAGLLGAIVGTKKGETKFFVGENAVYAFTVTNVEPTKQTNANWVDQWKRGHITFVNPQYGQLDLMTLLLGRQMPMGPQSPQVYTTGAYSFYENLAKFQ